MSKKIHTGILLISEEAVLDSVAVVKNFDSLEDAKAWFKMEKEGIYSDLQEFVDDNHNYSSVEEKNELMDEYVREDSEFIYKVDLGHIAFALELRDGSVGLVNSVGF